MSYVSQLFGQFTYFDLQLGHPDWKTKTVLDFGGNIGNILRDPMSTIDPAKYWCLDVSRSAIEQGSRTQPHAHWVFYDRYNFAFNPSGIKSLEIPDLGEEFDYILAYSVFTHTSKAEMLELIGQLESRLAPTGVLAFTFIDPHFNPATSGGRLRLGYYNGTYLTQVVEDSAIEERRRRQGYNEVYEREHAEGIKGKRRAVDSGSLLARAATARWCTLINDQDLYVDTDDVDLSGQTEERSYLTLYTEAYIKDMFPVAVVLPPPYEAYRPCVESVLQHCCVLRKLTNST